MKEQLEDFSDEKEEGIQETSLLKAELSAKERTIAKLQAELDVEKREKATLAVEQWEQKQKSVSDEEWRAFIEWRLKAAKDRVRPQEH